MSNSLQYPFNPVIWPAVPHDFTGDNNLGFSTDDSTQRFTIGTRAMSWDGSVLRYHKAGSTYTSYQSAVWSQATSADVGFEGINSSSPKGSRTVTIDEPGITENQFAGGQILIFHATGNGSLYTVVGNTASSGDDIVVITIDRPLAAAIVAEAFELYASPFADLRQGNSGNDKSFWGVPMALVTSGSYGWVKTWGITFIAPQSTVGDQGVAACYFRHDGSIDARGSFSTTLVTDQYAGFRVVGKASGDGPLMMLQVAIQKGIAMTMIKDGKRIPPKEVEAMAKEEKKKSDKKQFVWGRTKARPHKLRADMEILKRVKAPTEIVSATESESNIRDEVNLRTCKAGYTDRDGQPKISRNNGAGKGDISRPCNIKRYQENYVKIFGHN